MAEYDVTITNGVGSANLPCGDYTVTANVTGYSNLTLLPASFTATSEGALQAFSIEATGTFTLNVNDTGAEGGTAITAGTFIRCNSDGSEEYGVAKTISDSGVCEFDKVPYGDAITPYLIYVKQLTSDTTHSICPDVLTCSLDSSSCSQYVQNCDATEQSFTFTDANYSGLNVSGDLTFNGPTE